MSIAESANAVRAHAAASTHYPVNLRVTIPFLPQPLFVAFIVGAERRSPERLREERALHPVNTWGNLAAVIATTTVAAIAALFVTLILTSL